MEAPELITTVQAGYIEGFTLNGTIAFISDYDTSSLKIFNFADLLAPFIINSVSIPFATTGLLLFGAMLQLEQKQQSKLSRQR